MIFYCVFTLMAVKLLSKYVALFQQALWWFLSPAVLLREAEGEFAAVGGGDGEEIGGRGT